MAKSFILLLSFVLICFWVVGCDEETPTDPGGGGGGTANEAPGTPTIDTGSGAPANGATDQAISAQLHWACSDPDGDALTYDVHFGTVASPPVVSTDQAAVTYDPGTLANGTTYYWQIVAEDPDAESTSSAVWSFTTVALAGETIAAPSAVSGPSSGYTTGDLSYSANATTSSEGHTLEYQFDWDDGPFSSWSTSRMVNHTWAAAGTYEVKARARCQTHTAIESGWSPARSVVITVQTEVVTSPYGITVDDDYVDVGVTLNFDAPSGGISTLGHTLEFHWDFGDLTTSAWAATREASHAYAAGGTFPAKIRARCATHTSVVSVWSSEEDVHIVSGGETISTPSITTPYDEATKTITVGDNLTCYASNAASSMGHDLQWRYDFEDGTNTPWADVRSAEHTFNTYGDQPVKVQARCKDHPAVESAWSDAITIHVLEFISAPVCSGPATAEKWTEVTFTATGAASSEGHVLEYQLGWSSSQWSTPTTGDWTTIDNLKHTFNVPRDYWVRVYARCATHTDVEAFVTLSTPPPHVITITDITR